MTVIIRKLKTKALVVVGVLLAAILCAAIVVGCTGGDGTGAGRDSKVATAGQGTPVREAAGEHGVVGEGGEGVGEHGGAGEGSAGEFGGEGPGESGGSGSEEGSGINLAPDETFDMVRGGARLILNYDAGSNSFRGTVENTTSSVLTQVRIEVHLSNGTELGPTAPVDLAPGQLVAVDLPSTQASFSGWIAHAEVGGGAEGGRSAGEAAGEHGGGGEGSGSEVGEAGGEGGGESGGSGSEEGSGANLAPDETFDMVRGGARLILSYDAASNSFRGTVENTTNSVLTQVRIEVHLSNGTELGPTAPVDLAPGQVVAVDLPSTQASFSGWIAHAEVGGGAEGGQSGGEAAGERGGGEGGETGGEGGGTGAEAGEAAMSSPVIALDQTWDGVLGGLAVSARYDAVARTVHATVRNTLSETLCYVQAEPHLKLGTRTVGELGPDMLGDLSPGQEATSSLTVAGEPTLAGVSYDGYVVHMEVFDCGGPGPKPHAGGEGAEGGAGEGAGGEGHGPGGEGTGGEGGGEEGSGAKLAPDETFDMVRGGARLILGYDAESNSFRGTVENTTTSVLTRVRIEVHLSNGTELGPTTPVDLAPGQVVEIDLPSTQASFTGWIAHAEVGGDEGGGESGGEHGSGGG